MNVARRRSPPRRRRRRDVQQIQVSLLLPMSLLRRMICWSYGGRVAFDVLCRQQLSDLARVHRFGVAGRSVECLRHWRGYLRIGVDHILSYSAADVRRWRCEGTLVRAMEHLQRRQWSWEAGLESYHRPVQFRAVGPHGDILVWELVAESFWTEHDFGETVEVTGWCFRLRSVFPPLGSGSSRGRSRSRSRSGGATGSNARSSRDP